MEYVHASECACHLARILFSSSVHSGGGISSSACMGYTRRLSLRRTTCFSSFNSDRAAAAQLLSKPFGINPTPLFPSSSSSSQMCVCVYVRTIIGLPPCHPSSLSHIRTSDRAGREKLGASRQSLSSSSPHTCFTAALFIRAAPGLVQVGERESAHRPKLGHRPRRRRRAPLSLSPIPFR